MIDTWPPELRIRGARVSGGQLARIAHTEVQEFRAHVQPRLTSDQDDRLGGLRALKAAFERAVGGHELPGAVDVPIVFCDLRDLTAYADLEGDAAAIDVIDRLTEVVLQERYFGGAVNLAARLLSAAGRDELVATTPVIDATRGAFAWHRVGARRIRGVSEPVEIYRLRDE